MKVIRIGSEAKFQDLIKNKVYVLFSGDYCPDCRIFQLVLNKVSDQFVDVVIYYLDVVVFPKISQGEQIRSIPNLVIYENGKQIKTLADYSEEGLSHFLKQN